MSISLLHSQIANNMEDQENWEVEDINTQSSYSNGIKNEDEVTQTIAEQLGQGIQRRGGNY